MTAMRLEKLRQIDLNLLITFAAIAEEKSVTAAATPVAIEPACCKPGTPARTRNVSR